MKVEIDGKMMVYIGGSGEAPALPQPPRLLGLRPRDGMYKFAIAIKCPTATCQSSAARARISSANAIKKALS